jgi:hypothetical protein
VASAGELKGLYRAGERRKARGNSIAAGHLLKPGPSLKCVDGLRFKLIEQDVNRRELGFWNENLGDDTYAPAAIALELNWAYNLTQRSVLQPLPRLTGQISTHGRIAAIGIGAGKQGF